MENISKLINRYKELTIRLSRDNDQAAGQEMHEIRCALNAVGCQSAWMQAQRQAEEHLCRTCGDEFEDPADIENGVCWYCREAAKDEAAMIKGIALCCRPH
jgi:hypothetical protein